MKTSSENQKLLTNNKKRQREKTKEVVQKRKPKFTKFTTEKEKFTKFAKFASEDQDKFTTEEPENKFTTERRKPLKGKRMLSLKKISVDSLLSFPPGHKPNPALKSQGLTTQQGAALKKKNNQNKITKYFK